MELARGVRDFGPEEMRLRSTVVRAITHQFLLYGFEELQTPILERLETLTAKMQGSDATDVSKEIFRVSDQGGRDLGLRFDLTVPLARYVAMHKEIKLPLRRFEIGRVYRDGPIKLGRYREFIQCDADIIGATSVLADAECINLAASVFAALGIDITLHVNNRTILDALCANIGIRDATDVIITIDKLEKIGESGVRKELAEKGVRADQQDALLAILLTEGTNAGKLALLEKELGTAAVTPMKELLSALTTEVVFTPSLARGLAYYTGTVYEAFAAEGPVKGSLMGGGRYDKLVSILTAGAVDQPAVGVSFGIEPICEVLRSRTTVPAPSPTAVCLVPVGNTLATCRSILHSLRERDMSAVMDLNGRSITRNLEYAAKLGIPFAIIVGERDLEKGMLTLRHLPSGTEKHLTASDIDALVIELRAYQAID